MNRKIFHIFLFILFTVSSVNAQQKNFILHTVKQGETLSIIAKKYHTTVGDIMRLNVMNAQSRLVYGSTIKIPTEIGVVDSISVLPEPIPAKPIEEIKLPVPDGIVHEVKLGETLFSISRMYSVSIDDLKKLNNLNSNEILVGQMIVIKNNVNKVPNTEIPDTADISTGKTNTKKKVKQTKYKKQTQEINTKKQIRERPVDIIRAAPAGEGFFKNSFQSQKKSHEKTGLAMTFKSESGWDDGYFYVLMNDVAIGTIIQLTAANGKQVYAKVLMDLGDMPANETLTFRITNATAAALGISSEPVELKAVY